MIYRSGGRSKPCVWLKKKKSDITLTQIVGSSVVTLSVVYLIKVRPERNGRLSIYGMSFVLLHSWKEKMAQLCINKNS